MLVVDGGFVQNRHFVHGTNRVWRNGKWKGESEEEREMENILEAKRGMELNRRSRRQTTTAAREEEKRLAGAKPGGSVIPT